MWCAVYGQLRVVQGVCSEVSAGRLTYKMPFPFGFRGSRSTNDSGLPNQDEIQKEKEKFLNMPLDEKRKQYRHSTFYTVDQISTWQDYFLHFKEDLKKQFSEVFGNKPPANSCSIDTDLNKKVSMWEGDITSLETDAIVNAANSRLLGGGGVDGAIHRAAGTFLTDECATLEGCAEGDAKITGGYHLPAKYVIHTVGPKGEKPEKLESCYRNSLELVIKNQLRTVAFPCISTGIYGYPPDKAAHVALKTVRTFLEMNQGSIDRVIFCLFLKEDVKIYEKLMQVYFPVPDMQTHL